MGACLCKQSDLGSPQTAAPSPDLPPELAAQVFCRLPSYDDRRSFRAVCRVWRLASQQQGLLPPAMPCINLGAGAYQSLIDGKVRRFSLPKGYRAGASFDGWLFRYHEGSRRCFLRAPFSGAVIEVPARYHKSWFNFLAANVWASRWLLDRTLNGRGMYMKMVVCSPSLVVAIFGYHRHYVHPFTHFAYFSPAQLEQQQSRLVWSAVPRPYDYSPPYVYRDIAFYNGMAFGLSSKEDLYCHHVDDETHRMQEQPIIHRMNDSWQYYRANISLQYRAAMLRPSGQLQKAVGPG
jgi:hypothetical protein